MLTVQKSQRGHKSNGVGECHRWMWKIRDDSHFPPRTVGWFATEAHAVTALDAINKKGLSQ